MPRFWDRLVDSLPRESKNLVWRVPLVVAVIVLSLLVFIPFQETPYAVTQVIDTYEKDAVKLDKREITATVRAVVRTDLPVRRDELTLPQGASVAEMKAAADGTGSEVVIEAEGVAPNAFRTELERAFAAYAKGDKSKLIASYKVSDRNCEVTNRLVWFTSFFHYKNERELKAEDWKPFDGRARKRRTLQVMAGGLNLGLDLRGGTELLYRILHPEGSKAAAKADEIKAVIQRRVDAYGLREPRIQAQGGDRILIQLPGQATSQLETIKSVIQNIGHLEFRIVADAKSQPYQEWDKSGMTKDPPGYTTYSVRSLKEGENEVEVRKILVSNRPEMTGEHITSTRIITGGRSLYPSVGLSFSPRGEQIFASVTGENIGKQMAIILNTRRDANDNIIAKGTCYSAPVIKTKIFGDAEITGDFSMDTAKALRTVLMAGSLPAPLELESENTVGASLGPALIAKGVRAIAIGFAAVVVFMLLYYRFAGIIADFALVLNLLIVVSIMILFDATLTLPGIAGLLLTVGMSVDANVLIFERIREEMGTTGDKPLRLAIRDGYGRAFWTIFDANLTTLLTAVILYWRGTGAIKGFAIVLTIGILTSMFTALVVTRVIFDILTWRRWLTRLPMAQLIKRPSISFMRLRNRFLIASASLVVLGLAVFAYRGDDNWDIDFRGGQLIHVVFQEPQDADAIAHELASRRAEFSDCEVQPIAASAEAGVAALPGRRSREFVIRFPALSEATIKNIRVSPIAGPGTVDLAVTLHTPMRLADLEAALKLAKIYGYLPKPAGEADADGKHATFAIKAPLIDADAARAELEKALATYKPEGQQTAFAAFEAATPSINYRTSCEVEIDRPVPLAEIERELKAGGDHWRVEPKGAEGEPGTYKQFVIRSSLDSGPALRERVGRVFASQTYEAVIRKQFGDRLAPDGVQIKQGGEGKATVVIRTTEPLKAATLTEKLASWDIEAALVGDPPPEAKIFELSVAADKAEELARRIRADIETFALSAGIPRVAKVGPAVAKEMLIWAAVAIAAASVLIIAYVWLRFERFKYGVAAVAALLHDVFITVGVLALLGVKINLPIVAALLTIIGYSINDTIVVFDRIRENLRRQRKRDVDASTIDASVNQVLSRTVLTSVTTLLAVLALFAFAGGVIQDFATALLIGVVVGTYSSVFIASPLLILHQEHVEKRLRG